MKSKHKSSFQENVIALIFGLILGSAIFGAGLSIVTLIWAISKL